MTSDAESTAPSLPADGASNRPYVLDPLEHLRLAKFIAGKFYRKVNHRVDKADILGAAYEGLLQGCRAFDPSKGCQPATFLDDCIRHKILEVLGKRTATGRNSPLARFVSLDAPLFYKHGSSDTEHALEDTLAAPSEESNFDPRIRTIAAEWIKSLPPKYRRIVYLRFIEQLTCEEVAEQLGISKQAVSKTELRAIEELKRRIGNVE